MLEPSQQIGRALMILGGLLAALGALFYFGGKLPFRLGRLPGDIIHRGEHSTFYFPLMTCIVLSVVFSVVMWFINHFRR